MNVNWNVSKRPSSRVEPSHLGMLKTKTTQIFLLAQLILFTVSMCIQFDPIRFDSISCGVNELMRCVVYFVLKVWSTDAR